MKFSGRLPITQKKTTPPPPPSPTKTLDSEATSDYVIPKRVSGINTMLAAQTFIRRRGANAAMAPFRSVSAMGHNSAADTEGSDSGNPKGTRRMRIALRMYSCRFGDWLLLTFPSSVCLPHPLDCGSMPRVNQDHRESGGQRGKSEDGKLLVVVATHAHQDQYSGFAR